MSSIPSFTWEPEPLIFHAGSSVFPFTGYLIVTPTPPQQSHLNRSRADQPPGSQSPLIYVHKVDPTAPLGSFENPYSTSNAPQSPHLSPTNPSLPSVFNTFESSHRRDSFEPYNPRQATPPRRSHQPPSRSARKAHISNVVDDDDYPLPPPVPAKQPLDTQSTTYTRNRSRRRFHIQQESPSTPPLPRPPPPVHRPDRRVHFAATDHYATPSSPIRRSFSYSPPPLPRPRSPITAQPPSSHRLQHRSPTPTQPCLSSPRALSSRTFKWPLCTLCSEMPATVENEGGELRFCGGCWEEAREAEERVVFRGRGTERRRRGGGGGEIS